LEKSHFLKKSDKFFHYEKVNFFHFLKNFKNFSIFEIFQKLFDPRVFLGGAGAKMVILVKNGQIWKIWSFLAQKWLF